MKLKRLSPATIERYLKPNPITHNIDGKIKGCTLKLGGVSITSKNLVFDIQMKLREDGIAVSPSSVTQNSSQKSNLTVAVVQPKPITVLINEAWRTCKLDRRGQFQLNDMVMAKLKGHVAWPSRIIAFVNKHKAKVDFFGANQNEKFGFVSITEMVHYDESNDVIRLTLKRDFAHKEKFKKGIREVELMLGMSSHKSILND